MLNNPFARCVLRQAPATLLLAAVLLSPAPSSGQGTKGGGKSRPDFIPAGYDDYKNMLDQLGIKKVRPGEVGVAPTRRRK